MPTTDTPKRGPGRPPKYGEAMSPAHRQQRHKAALLARLDRAEKALLAVDKQLVSIIEKIGAGGEGPASAKGVAEYAREIVGGVLDYRE